jgi:hypothetical protein
MWTEVYIRKVDRRDELLACTIDEPKRKTRDLRKRVAKFIEVDCGILGHLLGTVTNFSETYLSRNKWKWK